MKSEMTKRERVEAAFKFQETDRIPVYDIIINDDVIEHFTGKYPPLGEKGAELQCQAIAQALDMTRMAGIGPTEEHEYEDDDGYIHYKKRWISGGILKRPFSDEKGAKKWLKKAVDRLQTQVNNFDPVQVKTYFQDNFNKLRNYMGDDTVILHGQSGTGLDELRYNLGLELFSYISVDEPGLISEFLDFSTEKEVKTIHAIADRKLSPCALTYGDIAFKGSLLHPPQWLKEEFLPRLQKLNDAWHEHDIKCLFHSDGDLTEILPDLVDTDIDGLNPIETAAGMELKEVREEYPDIFLAGGIDISNLMAYGTKEEVREVCEQAIKDANPGYFIGSTTELDNGSKLENVLTMLNVAWNYE